MTNRLHVLVIEDSPTDAKLIAQALRRTERPVELERVQDEAAMRAALARQSWDLITCDWSMPAFSATRALAVYKEVAVDIPFIIVSGTVGEEAAVDAMRAGAHDYVLKDRLARLSPAVERELRESEVRAARRSAEIARDESELRLRRLAESGIIGIQVADRAGTFLEANDAFLSMVGYSRQELIGGGLGWHDLTPVEFIRQGSGAIQQLQSNGFAAPWEKAYVRKDGSRVPVIIGVATLDESRTISCVADLTALKRAEASLQIQEARFRALIEQSEDGVTLASLDGTIVYATPTAARIFGHSAEALLSKRITDLVHPDDVASFKETMSRVRAAPSAKVSTKYRIIRGDGAVRRIEAIATNCLADPAIGAVVGNFRDVTDQERAAEDLRRSEARFTRLAESGVIGILVADVNGGLHEANDAYLNMLGYTREDMLAGLIRWTELTPPEWMESDEIALAQLQAAGVARPWEKELYRKDGSRVPVLLCVAMLDYPNCIVVAADLTSRKQAEAALRKSEEQFRQAQKMEAIGQLAGGVAHDFNNMLSVILSYGDMLLADLKSGDPMRDDVVEIRNAGRRAAELTRQLLMFSRQQVLAPQVLDLNETLAKMQNMLRRLVGEDVDLVSVPCASLGRVRADPGSIEQVIMNLAVNARDAMPTGGHLTLETSNVDLDEAYAREHVGTKPGPHVMLAVTDSGSGMDNATLARIFEPFFTTKERGKGTGLGLSTVFGIVQQSQGSIWVYSEPGHGSTFKIYLPRVDTEVATVLSPDASKSPDGAETVLLVEDEEQVRAVARSILRRCGYRVIEARGAAEALRLSAETPDKIHLLLTDVVMPQMSGPDLAKRLVEQRPMIRVLCMSGYTDDSVVRHGIVDGEIAFIQKPITPASLAQKVREVLDAPGPSVVS